MNTDFEKKCKELLAELGIASGADVLSVKALAGGVASDIAAIDVGEHTLCAKFALPKLKVAEEWHAPIHRNLAEYKWLQFAAQVAPENSIKLFGMSEKHHGFAMEYLHGKTIYVWKTALLNGDTAGDAAALVGDLVGRIHTASSAPEFDKSQFQNQQDFYALRLEPYLKFAAGRHSSVMSELNKLADGFFDNAQILIHGDVSPKNILFRNGLPIILDAECATMGDASFDCAFCLNHLILKAIHIPDTRVELFSSVINFWTAYAKHVSWEPRDDLEQRICRLLPALMLARVDGKSPVEYLDENEKEIVRNISIPLIKNPPDHLHKVIENLNALFLKTTS